MNFSDNTSLVKYLTNTGILHSQKTINAFLAVDRRDFVPGKYIKKTYWDSPLSLGWQATISQPTTVAIMLELLQAKKGDKILDIGSGSGWTTALLAHIVGKNGQVAGLEINPQLVAFGQDNLMKYNFPQAQIRLVKKNILGLPGRTFDKILVSASAASLPQTLIDQLKPGGRLVIPIKHSVFLITKDEKGLIKKEERPGFEFVPLL